MVVVDFLKVIFIFRQMILINPVDLSIEYFDLFILFEKWLVLRMTCLSILFS